MNNINKQTEPMAMTPMADDAAELTSPSSVEPWLLNTVLKLPETRRKWSGRPYNPYKLVDLRSTSSEFKRVKTHFTASDDSLRVSKIQRVENPFLLAQFLMKKQKMIGVATEKHLFHGTDRANIDSICKNNFDWRLRGSCRGHLYGQGTYFARDAVYARPYTRSKTMIYARVLVGKSTTGRTTTQIPPEPFDTTQNDAGTVFVKYEDDDFYPGYVIYYEIAQTTGAMVAQRKTLGTGNLSTLPVTAKNTTSSLDNNQSGSNNNQNDDRGDSKINHCGTVKRVTPSTANVSLSPAATGESHNSSSDRSDSNDETDDRNSSDYFDITDQSDYSDSDDVSDDFDSNSESEYFNSIDSTTDEGETTDMNNQSDANFDSNNECDDFDMTGEEDDVDMDVD